MKLGKTTAARPPQNKLRRGWSEQQSEFWFRVAVALVGLLLRVWVRRFRVIGVEHLPPSGGIFVIANHTSGTDPFLLGYSIRHRMPYGPGKLYLFENPIAGFLMRKIGIFPIRQGVADAPAVRAMVELYRKQRVVIVFPEGGRSTTGHLQDFFPEFARLVIKLKAPLLPAGISGANDLLPVGSVFPRFNSAVVVKFGEQFDLSDFYDDALTPERSKVAASVMQARVAALVDEADAERRRL